MSNSFLHTRKILPHIKKDAKKGLSKAHKIHVFTVKNFEAQCSFMILSKILTRFLASLQTFKILHIIM